MKIREVILETLNVEAIATYYSNILELPVQKVNNICTIGIGTSHLKFIKSHGLTDPFYHFAITIPSNKIVEAKEWLERKHIELLWMEDYQNVIANFVNWNAHSIYFSDTTGNIVELIARHDLNNSTSDVFNSSHLLSLSEIGIVFKKEAIETGTKELTRYCKLDYFKKQPPFPHFKALGDDEGLFIIVPENRNWYPTQKQAEVFPVTVEFEINGVLCFKKF
jgi:hypothetical protein